ncbi:MAG TPA: hypothetical protein VLR71_09030 [Casimicrobiaceae bacterium]|nr:hypothetical protein [Casimicrobiaceae bacterium]
MKQNHRRRSTRARSVLSVCMTLGAVALASTAWADGLDHAQAEHMRLLGHNDMQNRPIYQPTVHKYPTHTAKMGSTAADAYASKTIFFAGLHAATGGGGCTGSLPNPLNGGACEKDGTLIVDATNPTDPVVIKHLPPANPANALAQMVRVCDGQDGKLGQTGHVYMLRNDGSGGGNGQHDVYDVTDPVNPVLLSVPVSGLTATHKSWWECETGIAWIVAGANAPQAPNPDGWKTNQHVKLFDLSDPSHPVYIRDIGLVGQNPGSTTEATSGGIHGPYIALANPLTGETVNRAYMPYGTSELGTLQVVDRLKVLPDFTTSAGQHIAGTWDGLGTARAQAPTDDDMKAIVIGSMLMTPTEGAHSACPVFNTALKHFQGFTSYTTRDYVQLISEEVDNHCSGAPHFGYMVDVTRDKTGKGADGISGEMRPMVISTMQVFEDSAKPDYCTRGTRFGNHSCNEALASVPSTFFAPDFGKLTYIAYFDGGARVFDIRDPYHPLEVAHYVAPVHPLAYGEQPPNVINGQLVHDVSHNNLEEDSNGLIYSVDRLGYGMDILMLMPPAALIRNTP